MMSAKISNNVYVSQVKVANRVSTQSSVSISLIFHSIKLVINASGAIYVLTSFKVQFRIYGLILIQLNIE